MCSIKWSWQPVIVWLVVKHQSNIDFNWNVQPHPHSCLHNPTFPHFIEIIQPVLLTTAYQVADIRCNSLLAAGRILTQVLCFSLQLTGDGDPTLLKISMGSLGSTALNVVVVFGVVWVKAMQWASTWEGVQETTLLCVIYSLTLISFPLPCSHNRSTWSKGEALTACVPLCLCASWLLLMNSILIKLFCVLSPFFQHQGQKGEPGDITDVSWHYAAP